MKHSSSFVLSVLLIFVMLVGCKPVADLSPAAPAAAQSDSSDSPTPITPAPLPNQEESASSWQIILQTEVQHATTIAGFLDEHHGITAGVGGEVHTTTDGGNTWPEAANSSLCRFGLEIFDEQVAWHCGNGGHVRVSKDSGQTWHVVADFGPNEPRHCRMLSFVEPETGWVATPDQLGATTDGGTSWTEINLPEGIQNMAAIALRTSNDGYLLDKKGDVFITQDGGETWISGSLGLEAGKELMDFNAPMAAMRWYDADHGLVVVSLVGKGDSEVLAFHTADGGQTWEQESVPAQFGVLYLTRDGRVLTITHLGNKITVLRYEGL